MFRIILGHIIDFVRVIFGRYIENSYSKKKVEFNKFINKRKKRADYMLKNMDISHRLHEFFLTFCYVGKFRHAPGTFASIVTVVAWLFLTTMFIYYQFTVKFQVIFWSIFVVLIFIYATFIIDLYCKKQGLPSDHSSIVIDEVAGQIIAIIISYPLVEPLYFITKNVKIDFLIIAGHLAFSFVLFRFFDIAKPSIIGFVDSKFKGSVGVMLDDIMAGIISGLITVMIILISKNFTEIRTFL